MTEIDQSSAGIYLCQCKYALEIIYETSLLGSKRSSTFLDPNHQLAKAMGDFCEHPDRCLHFVGKLIHLTNTRLDLVYILHVLAQFMQSPSIVWNIGTMLHIVRFLKDNLGQSVLCADNSLSLTAYFDFDWTSCFINRRSIIGYFIYLGGSLIFWKTNKQHTIS